MGVKFSQLPVAAEVAADDYLAVLDTSDNILKRTTADHAVASTVFGIGDSTNFGHVKLTDTFATTAGAAADGIGASQNALYNVHVEATALATTAAPGRVQPDGETILVDANGVIEVNPEALPEAGVKAVYETATATSAHSIGDLVYVSNQLYEVTVAIAPGDTITVGTNVKAADIAADTPVYISGLPGSGGGGGGGGTAADITYDNTLSGLASTSVQGAIDELAQGGSAVGSEVNLLTSTSAFYNKTVSVVGTHATYTATFDSTGHAKVNVQYVDLYDVVCEGYHASVRVTAMGLVYTVPIDSDYKTIQIHALFADAYGGMLTIKYGSDVRAALTLDPEDGTCEFRAAQIGEYTMTWVSDLDNTYINSFEVTELDKANQEVAFAGSDSPTTFTFAVADDAEIFALVESADKGYLDLYTDCGWRVGQEHNVTLSAIAATGTYDGVTWTVGESHDSEEVTLVLMHRGLYTLVDPVLDKSGNSRSTCSFICGMKQSYATTGYMNSTTANAGSWNASARRAWCNGGFREAMPALLQKAFKQFNTVTGDYNGAASGGSNITSQDYFALAAEKEIFGAKSYCTDNEAAALTQFEWYATSSNRIKTKGNTGSAYYWWERSPYYDDARHFCLVGNGGNANFNYPSTANGLSPFGCL